jgi:zinc protease
VRSKATLQAITILITATALTLAARAQSGRGRQKAPVPEPTTSPPQVVVPEAVAVVDRQQSGTTARFVLRNGMIIIINEQHATQIVALVASFKVGYCDEPDSTRGIAHLLERLVMTGTTPRIRALGAVITSTTTCDNTCFKIIVAPQKTKEALAAVADMIKHPKLAADQLRRQSQIVAESLTYDDPAAYAIMRLSELALRRTTVQREALLGSITEEQVVEFYNRFYRPDNLTISVVGDVSTFDTLVQIQKLYSDFKSAPITSQTDQPANSTKPSPPSTTGAIENLRQSNAQQLRYAEERGDISRSILSIGFRVARLNSEDWPAVEVLSAIIGQGRASRLARSLIYNQVAASRVEASYLPFRDQGLLVIQIEAIPNSIDKVEASLFKEADRLRRELPQQDELARAKAILEKRFSDCMGDYLSRAQHLASMGTRAFDYNALIRAVQAEDIQRVAVKYLTPANLAVYEYEPLGAPPRTFDADSFATTVAQWAPGFVQPVKEARAKAGTTPNSANAPEGEQVEGDRAYLESLEPLPIKDFSTLHGPRAYVREDHSQPKVTIALLFHGGRVSEDETNSGITELMLRSMLYGTSRSSATELAQQLDRLGANVEPVVERDFFGLMLSVLSRNADEATHLLREVIEEPAFRDDGIARARVEQIGTIRASRDNVVERSRELLFQAIFGDHPYALPPHGREEVVSRLDSDQLRNWHTRTIKHQLPLVIIVGDTDGSALVSAELAEGFKRREINQVVHIKVASAAAPNEKVENKRIRNTVEAIGFVGPKAEATEQSVLELIEVAINGSGGWLSAELIDSGLAYQASMSSEVMMMAEAICVTYVTSSENRQHARTKLIAEVNRLAREGLGTDEFEKSRAAAATLKLLALESQPTRAIEYARAIFNRRQPSQVDEAADRILKVTADDVKRVAATYFKPSVYAGIIRPITQLPAKNE